jgi:uncharacterized protein (TIGR02246 family)
MRIVVVFMVPYNQEVVMTNYSGVNTPASTLESVPPIHRQETHSVERVIGDFILAWNAHDATKMAALWAEDGDLINPMGKLARGRDQVRALFTEEQGGLMKGTTCEMTLSSVRWAADDIVVVDAECFIKGMRDSGGKELPIFKPHVLLVLHRIESDRWLVLSARPYLYSSYPTIGK